MTHVSFPSGPWARPLFRSEVRPASCESLAFSALTSVSVGAMPRCISHDISCCDLLSVYVVEPEPSAREAKSVLLTRAGQKVTTFASEAAFLEVAGALAAG